MSNRRNRPANRWGCKPVEDVCVEHDAPRVCRHGCEEVAPHECADVPGSVAEAKAAKRQLRRDP